MKVNTGHLTYCTNIHAGKNWDEDFNALKQNFPIVKQNVAPTAALGLGLRLSNTASLQLQNAAELELFKQWLQENDAYVFTMNGFPYGDFHHTIVKADVHAPDWTTDDRKDYTVRLFHILKSLVPEGMDGGISTSPLSYRHWFKAPEALKEATEKATLNIIEVIKVLASINNEQGLLLHLDIEPEPDGILETGREFIDWFEQYLLPIGIPEIKNLFNTTDQEAEAIIKQHLCLCYDVCHFAIGYEDHGAVLAELERKNIRVGKIQISAALKASLDGSGEEKQQIKQSFTTFNEPTYLHQVVALQNDGGVKRYQDLPEALDDFENEAAKEWRAHFHVPISVHDIGLLQSTQSDISKVLELQKARPFTNHLEVETYTWEVLPEHLKLPIAQSISNELNWVIDTLA
ncbi:metabolite traffic protein EboE [Pedobacter frigoris]|uniref:Xylose isomerase n=1 Tax=Pedobacter frigoris TaxID=2571272 RepID=A0A4U1CPM4_9SPHI|nr:metabolite traffic protein EboE [Pedobacter frigoris]TKC07384.1 xylose isomerase [Pedobacter frigoris]